MLPDEGSATYRRQGLAHSLVCAITVALRDRCGKRGGGRGRVGGWREELEGEGEGGGEGRW